MACILAVAHGQDTLPDQIRTAQSSGDYDRAAQLYLKLIASGTDSAEIRNNCGIMLHLAGKNREALEQFRIALRQNNDLPGANLFAGLSLFDLGNVRAALPYLQRAQALDPSRPGPMLALAKTYVALRDFRTANDWYRKAAAADAESAEAWFGIGVTDRSMADAVLNDAARKGKVETQAVKGQAQALLDAALQALTRAVALDPNSPRTHLLMAESMSEEGKSAQAVAEYQAVMKLDPSLDAAPLGLASEYWKQRQFDQAVPLLQRVLSKTPKDPEANGIMADIAQHNGDNAKAEQYAAVALAGNPSLIETRLVLARVALAQHRPQLAVEQLTRIASADPDGSYHYLLYRAYHELGNEAAAEAALVEYQRRRARASAQ